MSELYVHPETRINGQQIVFFEEYALSHGYSVYPSVTEWYYITFTDDKRLRIANTSTCDVTTSGDAISVSPKRLKAGMRFGGKTIMDVSLEVTNPTLCYKWDSSVSLFCGWVE